MNKVRTRTSRVQSKLELPRLPGLQPRPQEEQSPLQAVLFWQFLERDPTAAGVTIAHELHNYLC